MSDTVKGIRVSSPPAGGRTIYPDSLIFLALNVAQSEKFFDTISYVIDVRTEEHNRHQISIAFHGGGDKKLVIFCHGFRGTSVGPNRFFVTAANKLAEQGISSLRFDQYGSGNSEGDFLNSSFNDWMETTKSIAKSYLQKGFHVALFGQSMGGATVLGVGSELADLTAIVAWVPDPNVEKFNQPQERYIEEGGQRVQTLYWKEAHDANIASKLRNIKTPVYIVQCTNDEYVDKQNRDALSENATSYHEIEDFEGYNHSSWSYDQAEEIINKSVEFLARSFTK